MLKVSCVIPAYNEEPRIENVLRVACRHPLINEVIVVDDGSQDNTKEVIKKFQEVRLIINEKNRGKSYTVARGISSARGDIIILLDADLIGLTQKNITDLIEPVISGKADMSISLRQNAIWLYRKIGLDLVSGERVFYKKMVENDLEKIRNLFGYGLETCYFNKLIIKNRYRIKIVFWDNVSFVWKQQKDFWAGWKLDIAMNFKIARELYFFGVPYQIIKMLLLKVK